MEDRTQPCANCRCLAIRVPHLLRKLWRGLGALWLVVLLCLPCWAVSPTDWPYCCVADIWCGNAGGSGTLIGVAGSEGIVSTAAHVVEGGDSVTLAWPNGYRCSGRVVGRDSQLDLAVIRCKVQPGMVTPRCIRAATENDKFVLAIGYPFYSRNAPHWTTGRVIGYSGSDVQFTATPYLHSGFSGGALIGTDGAYLGSTNGYGDGYSYAASGRPMEQFLSRWVKVGAQ